MVYEIAQGWALKLDGVAPSIWQERARWFRHTLCDQSEEPISIFEQSKVEYAFLDGLRWSRGDVNVRLKGNTARVMMQKRATKCGLDRPAEIVTGDLNAAVHEIQSYDAHQQGVLAGESNVMLTGRDEGS